MLVGAVGIGGILLPSSLNMIAGLTLHQSMATSLFTFIFTGLAGTLAFQRRGSIDWAVARPVCCGAASTGWAGAWASSLLGAPTLAVILALVIVLAGAFTLRKPQRPSVTAPRSWLLLALAGAATGFVSGLAGVGGPVLSVPLMLLAGFPVLTAIGVGQVIQVVGALSGTAANGAMGTIDYQLAAFVTLFEIAGVFLGAHLIHRVDLLLAQRFVGALCIGAGLLLFARSFA